MSADKVRELILALQTRLGRLPTEDEVVDFIYGTDDERNAIWNTEGRTR